jgi:hypothetical protein
VLLERARQIDSVDDEILGKSTDLFKKCNTVLEAAEARIRLLNAIPAFCDAYPGICFQGISEGQLCDLVWAYLSLDKQHLAAHGTSDDREPTFYRVLRWLDKAVRSGDEVEMAKRWSEELFDRFWDAMVSAIFRYFMEND